MTIAVVVGNPKAGSRTLGVAKAVANSIFGISHTPNDIRVIDLAEMSSELFDFQSEEVNECLKAVAQSDLVVMASPTYKATYTGLLKSFLDRYENDALSGTICIPVMTGAAPIHALGTRSAFTSLAGRIRCFGTDPRHLRHRRAVRQA